jgi:hypothetical protein
LEKRFPLRPGQGPERFFPAFHRVCAAFVVLVAKAGKSVAERVPADGAEYLREAPPTVAATRLAVGQALRATCGSVLHLTVSARVQLVGAFAMLMFALSDSSLFSRQLSPGTGTKQLPLQVKEKADCPNEPQSLIVVKALKRLEVRLR